MVGGLSLRYTSTSCSVCCPIFVFFFFIIPRTPRSTLFPYTTLFRSNFIVTILNLRAPGMKMMRLPVFSWMTLVTSFLIITAFPVITVALVLLMFDRFFGTHFYLPSAGGDPVLWQHLFWIFGHPEVYILILPAMRIISEVLPTFARKPLFGYTVVVYSGVLIGFMGWGVWSHHMFSAGLGPIADYVF